MKKYIFIISLVMLLPLNSFPNEKYKVIKDKINVRIDSTVTSQILGVLNEDETVEILKESRDWIKILLPKRFKGFVSSQYVKKTSKVVGIVTASQLNLRIKPSLESYVIGKVKKNSELKLLRQNNDWYEISAYPYAKGWVHKKFLVKSDTKKPTSNSSKDIQNKIKKLSAPDIKKKKNLHENLIAKGVEILPFIEQIIPNADNNTCYSIIFILSSLGKTHTNLLPYFFKKITSLNIKSSSIYLDIIQGILNPKQNQKAYFYLAQQNNLTIKDIKDAKLFLSNIYNSTLNSN
ncbi:MAG: SH3 domain-containing protein [Candidatus Omnitrophica bacterium]|nr:SH3 domain-containing protein [Candidatus Omnitrophota bacterium]MCK5287693.1 SH3 domain-containing protein [Candidatus Omnitrophota bacterium]